MVPVALATTGFEAKLLAALLGAEGVVWELRGDVDGPYPVGGIEVLVPTDEAARAEEILAATAEVDDERFDDPTSRGRSGEAEVATATAVPRRARRGGLVALALCAVVVFGLVRLLSMA
jgi:hypothetical protein